MVVEGYQAVSAAWIDGGQRVGGESDTLAVAVDGLCPVLSLSVGGCGQDDIGHAFVNGDASTQGFGPAQRQLLSDMADAVNLVRGAGAGMVSCGNQYAAAEAASTVGASGAAEGAAAPPVQDYGLPVCSDSVVTSDPPPGEYKQVLDFVESLVAGCSYPDGNLAACEQVLDGLRGAQWSFNDCADAVDGHTKTVAAVNVGQNTAQFTAFMSDVVGAPGKGGLRGVAASAGGLADAMDQFMAQKRAARLQFGLSAAFLIGYFLAVAALSFLAGPEIEATDLAAAKTEGSALKAMMQTAAKGIVWVLKNPYIAGGLYGAGLDAAQQEAMIHEGLQKGWNYKELGEAGLAGVIAGGVMHGVGKYIEAGSNRVTKALAALMKSTGLKGAATRYGVEAASAGVGNFAAAAATQAIFNHGHVTWGQDAEQAALFGVGMAGIEGAKRLGTPHTARPGLAPESPSPDTRLATDAPDTQTGQKTPPDAALTATKTPIGRSDMAGLDKGSPEAGAIPGPAGGEPDNGLADGNSVAHNHLADILNQKTDVSASMPGDPEGSRRTADGRLHFKADKPGTYRDESFNQHFNDDPPGTMRAGDGKLYHYDPSRTYTDAAGTHQEGDPPGSFRNADGSLHFEGDNPYSGWRDANGNLHLNLDKAYTYHDANGVTHHYDDPPYTKRETFSDKLSEYIPPDSYRGPDGHWHNAGDAEVTYRDDQGYLHDKNDPENVYLDAQGLRHELGTNARFTYLGDDGELHFIDKPPHTYLDTKGRLHDNDDPPGTNRDRHGDLHNDGDPEGTHRDDQGKMHRRGDPPGTHRDDQDKLHRPSDPNGTHRDVQDRLHHDNDPPGTYRDNHRWLHVDGDPEGTYRDLKLRLHSRGDSIGTWRDESRRLHHDNDPPGTFRHDDGRIERDPQFDAGGLPRPPEGYHRDASLLLHHDSDHPGTYRDEAFRLHNDGDAPGTYRTDDGQWHRYSDPWGTYRDDTRYLLHNYGDPPGTYRNDHGPSFSGKPGSMPKTDVSAEDLGLHKFGDPLVGYRDARALLHNMGDEPGTFRDRAGNLHRIGDIPPVEDGLHRWPGDPDGSFRTADGRPHFAGDPRGYYRDELDLLHHENDPAGTHRTDDLRPHNNDVRSDFREEGDPPGSVRGPDGRLRMADDPPDIHRDDQFRQRHREGDPDGTYRTSDGVLHMRDDPENTYRDRNDLLLHKNLDPPDTYRGAEDMRLHRSGDPAGSFRSEDGKQLYVPGRIDPAPAPILRELNEGGAAMRTEVVDRLEFQDDVMNRYAVIPERWSRDPLLTADGSPRPITDGEMRPRDYEQGVLGDCGDVATTIASVRAFPEEMARRQGMTDDGNYQVVYNGVEWSSEENCYVPTEEWIVHEVTPEVPVLNSEPERPLFGSAKGTAVWGPVREKSLAALGEARDSLREAVRFGRYVDGRKGGPDPLPPFPDGYTRLNLGTRAEDRARLFTMLTGRKTRTFAQYKYDSIFMPQQRDLSEAVAENRPVLVSTKHLTEMGDDVMRFPHRIVAGHAYLVDHVDVEGNIHLWNPWGHRDPDPLTPEEFNKYFDSDYVTTVD